MELYFHLVILLVVGVIKKVKGKICREECLGKRVVLLRFAELDARGLGDRAYALSAIGNIATALCGRAWIPAPVKLLSVRHNRSPLTKGRGERVNETVSWNRYLNTQRISNPSVSFLAKSAACKIDALHIKTNASNFTQGFLIAATTNQSLCWTVHDDYWRWQWKPRLYTLSRPPPRLKFVDKDATLPYAEQCDYVQVSVSPLVLRIVSHLLAHLRTTLNDLGVLHVRRHDIRGKCNTSIPAIREYLHCSKQYMHTNIPKHFLFFSDDVQPVYRHQLANLLSNDFFASFLPKVPQIHDGDALLRNVTGQVFPKGINDNYLIYAAAATLIADARVSFNTIKCRDTIPCGENRQCHPCSSIPYHYQTPPPRRPRQQPVSGHQYNATSP